MFLIPQSQFQLILLELGFHYQHPPEGKSFSELILILFLLVVVRCSFPFVLKDKSIQKRIAISFVG